MNRYISDSVNIIDKDISSVKSKIEINVNYEFYKIVAHKYGYIQQNKTFQCQKMNISHIMCSFIVETTCNPSSLCAKIMYLKSRRFNVILSLVQERMWSTEKILKVLIMGDEAWLTQKGNADNTIKTLMRDFFLL